jgi:lysophospholipase L1-like esterase
MMRVARRIYFSWLGLGLAAVCPAAASAQPPPVSRPPSPSSPSSPPSPSSPCPEVPILRADLARAEARSRDWANLARYRAANAAVPAPAAGERRVVFMGDSITDGWSKPEHGGFFPGRPYINRGIGGQTTPQMLIRFRPDVIALKPRVVVILAGTNDIAGNTGPSRPSDIQDNIAAMAELARAHRIRVVLASILPVSDHERDERGRMRRQTHRRPPDQILAMNRWLRRYAAAHGHVYLDYFAAMVDTRGWLKQELSDDGLHPDAAGYRVMAPLAERAIRAALAR